MDANGNNAKMLREFLAEADVPCPGCGYNLRGLPTAACPECHQALLLRVTLEEPRLGPLIGVIVGLSAGSGFAAVVLTVFVLSWWGDGFRSDPHLMRSLLVFGAGLLALGAPIVLLARAQGRMWFRRLPDQRARWLIVVAWAATGAWLAAAVLLTG